MALKVARLYSRRVELKPSAFFCTGTPKPEEVVSKKRGSVTLIGMNGEGNYLGLDTAESLARALDSFEVDETSTVAILHGESGSFCKGYHPQQISGQPEFIESIERLGLLERYSSKPIVGAINGYAVGAGFDLALWCDFRIVEETAVLGCYARQFGVPLNERRAERLYSMLGLHKTLDLVLTGRIVKPKEAYESGIANRIVACGTAIGQSLNFAYSLANMPQSCLKADRARIYALSRKFGNKTKDKLQEGSQQLFCQAFEEFRTGCHITKSGDVRQKS